MVHINTLSVASLALFATSAAALPFPNFHLPSWMKSARSTDDDLSTPQFPQLAPRQNQGVFPSQVPVPTGTPTFPTGTALPIGTAFPTSFPAPTGAPSIVKRNANPQPKKRQDPWKPGVFVKRRDEQVVKRQVFALPTGTASSGFLAPTGGASPFNDAPHEPQAKQFGGARHGNFTPHWGAATTVYPPPPATAAPTPTGTAAPIPTGFSN
ncbi:hypothetical protein CERZMDRAFT_98599 [Cercospora zeae-maydis SCOH1-5]|uniref:Uncharacterized protein n=1 Tax=Cercospora zeae-maydis SCOH1-5 TaxID=717836 RepID=A0A6A6FCT5_9PEZI|nr:hypothetical protein CERZMDRAFT_98599 [Cercospora zeae-maydis SCOH1-5]